MTRITNTARDFLLHLTPTLAELAVRALKDLAEGRNTAETLSNVERDALSALAQATLDEALGRKPRA